MDDAFWRGEVIGELKLLARIVTVALLAAPNFAGTA